MKKSYLYYLLLLMPFIDVLTSIASYNNVFSIGIIVRIILISYSLYYIIKNKLLDKRLFIISFIYVLILFLYYLFISHDNLIMEFSNLLKIFYLPIILLLFINNNDRDINDSLLTKILFIYLLLYLLPYPFKLGHNINEIYPNKDLYLSYFYYGNEIVNVFIILIIKVNLYLIKNKSKYIYLFLVLIIFTTILLSTKTFIISMIIFIIYLIFKYFNKIFSKYKKVFLLGVIIFGCGLIYIIPKTSLYNNIITTLDYYHINNISELITINNIDNVIYSKRLSFVSDLNNQYINSSYMDILMGIGRTDFMKNTEIDIFDIFYSIGIIGVIIYFIWIIYVLKRCKLNKDTKFIFILLFIISLFSGHVLVSPMVTTYIGVLGSRYLNENMD